jgi:hypothetical protein
MLGLLSFNLLSVELSYMFIRKWSIEEQYVIKAN